MKTILELIESWRPCPRYKEYLEAGSLWVGMSIDDILRSKDIGRFDKEWFFEKLVGDRLNAVIYHRSIDVYGHSWEPFTYTYPTFLAMVDEYLEHANIDAAI